MNGLGASGKVPRASPGTRDNAGTRANPGMCVCPER